MYFPTVPTIATYDQSLPSSGALQESPEMMQSQVGGLKLGLLPAQKRPYWG